MSNYRMDTEAEEALFRSSPYAVYFVQSPSTLSHANSADDHRNNIINNESSPSPYRSSGPIITNNNTNTNNQEVVRLALSRYSSSRGSNHSSSVHWHDQKKISYDDDDHDQGGMVANGEKCCVSVKDVLRDDDEDEYEYDDDYNGRKRGWQQYFSFGYSSSVAWMVLQLSWRIIVSLLAALFVFYVATKPPAPKVSIKIAGIKEFSLAEGVDGTGVTTKFLSCNCSLDLVIDNQSKLFGLLLHPPLMAMSFGKLPFTVSQGSKLYATPDGSTLFKLYIGTRNKPMYGAGRNMQDQLESGKGLPIMITMDLKSRFHIVRGLINPKYHHRAECSLFLSSAYDKKHRTQAYNGTCRIRS